MAYIFFHFLSPEEDNGKPKEWAMVELQGSLETRHPVPLSGKFIGDLHFTHKVLGLYAQGHPRVDNPGVTHSVTLHSSLKQNSSQLSWRLIMK